MLDIFRWKQLYMQNENMKSAELIFPQCAKMKLLRVELSTCELPRLGSEH